MLQARLGGQKCAVQVDRQHLLPLGEGELVQRVDNLDPGVADENVNIAVGCDGGGDTNFYRRLVAHIHGHRERGVAGRGEFRHGRLRGRKD